MRRRRACRALGCLGFGTVGALTGCLDRSGPSVGLAVVDVHNLRTTPSRCTVQISREGTRIVDRTVVLDQRDGDRVDGVTITDERLGDRVAYTTTVTVDDDPLSETFGSHDAEAFVDDWSSHACYGSSFTIENARIGHALRTFESCSADVDG